MEGVLNQVLGSHKITHQQLGKTNTLLGQVLGVQSQILDIEKERLKQDRRDAQANKRKGADKGLAGLLQKDKDKDKKKEGGFLSNLMKGLGTLFAGGGFMKAILAALGLTALGKNISKFFGGVKKTIMGFGTGLKNLGKGIKTFFSGIKSTIGGIFGKGGFFGKLFGKGSALGKMLGKFGTKGLLKGGGILAALTSGISEFFESGKLTDALFASLGGGAGAVAGGALGSLLGPVGTVVGAALGSWIGTELTGILKEQLDKVPFLQDAFAFIDVEFNKMLDSIKELFSAVQTTFGQFTNMVDVLFRSLQRFYGDVIEPFFKSVADFYVGTWNKIVEGFTFVGNFLADTFNPVITSIGNYLQDTFGPGLETIGKTFEFLLKPLKELADVILPILETGLKGLGDFLKQFLNPGKMFVDGVKGNVEGAGNFFKGIGDYFRDYADGKQLGGFVGTVPNQGGNGDRFGAMLSPGSVVLNQTASNMMQSGGMVPTMLEQGERVFGPSDPSAGMALMMNSMIPRFQNGGIVQTKGSQETGSGFQPKGATDYQGRPVVFSKGGAEAWAKMGGNVRGQDVNSSKRSASYNAAMGGVPNSNHLSGDGVDVQTGSPSWHFLKKSGADYGWKFNNYLGAEGWHWDYKGAGGGAKKDGNEKGIASIAAGVPDALKMFATAIPEGTKAAGTAATEMISGLMKTISAELGPELMGSLGGIFSKSSMNGFIGPQPGAAQNAGGAGGGMGKAGGQASGAAAANKLYADMGFSKGQWDVYRNTVAQIESGGKYDIAGGSGGHYDGRYQLGAAAKTDGAKYAGVSDPGHGAGARAAYRKDPAMQEKLFTGFTKANYQYLMGNSQFANSSKERQLQILGYAHNQGMGGAEKWMTTGQVGKDGFGTKGTKYTDSIAAEFKKAPGLQTGGVTQVKGAPSANSVSMLHKSQENFANMIADKLTPVVVPMPMGGGGGDSQIVPQASSSTPFPNLPAEDNSVVSMEYKYRLTMGASV